MTARQVIENYHGLPPLYKILTWLVSIMMIVMSGALSLLWTEIHDLRADVKQVWTLPEHQYYATGQSQKNKTMEENIQWIQRNCCYGTPPSQ